MGGTVTLASHGTTVPPARPMPFWKISGASPGGAVGSGVTASGLSNRSYLFTATSSEPPGAMNVPSGMRSVVWPTFCS